MKMLKLTLIALFVASAAMAQRASDVFNKDVKVTWLGLDLTGAKLIGDRERWGSESDIRHLMDSWNDLILKEKDKYNVARAIGRTEVTNAVEVTKDNNANVEALEMYSDNIKDHFHLRPDDISRIVSGYDFKGMDGIGLMFVVESFSKSNQEGAVWVTFIDMGSREVLFTERMTGEPGGSGLRNYWGNAVYNILERIKKKEFEMWRKKHFRP